MSVTYPRKVFIIEDHALFSIGLRATLEKADPELTVIGDANNGIDGVERVLELEPDVVLMDIGLPGKDGIQATLEITARKPNIKVIALTSHDKDADIFAILAAGASGYCLKTISGQQLALAIRTVSDGAAWLDPSVAARVLRNAMPALLPAAPFNQKGERFGLTAREREVLGFIVEGCSNHDIAVRLFLSTETIKTHVRHIMEKLVVKDRTQAAVKALRDGLLIA